MKQSGREIDKISIRDYTSLSGCPVLYSSRSPDIVVEKRCSVLPHICKGCTYCTCMLSLIKAQTQIPLDSFHIIQQHYKKASFLSYIRSEYGNDLM